MRLRVLIWPLAVTLAVGCSRNAANQPPVATPGLSITQTNVPLGSPVEATYRFAVPAGAPRIAGDYRVFVHFLDADHELMWTDDHFPPVPTSKWTPGQTVEYTRTLFVPVYPYVGEATVEIGLYPTGGGERLTMAGNDKGQRSYQVGSLKLLPQTDNIFVIFKEGWHPAEQATDSSTEWQWTKKEALLTFRNPRRNVLLYLHVDSTPSAFAEPQAVIVRAGDLVLDTFAVSRVDAMIRKIPIAAGALGAGEMTEVKIQVDHTFVPAALPASSNRDPRELGVRVFHAFVVPQ
jgi:hypothetical protein